MTVGQEEIARANGRQSPTCQERRSDAKRITGIIGLTLAKRQNDEDKTGGLQVIRYGGWWQGLHVKREFHTGYFYDIAIL